tara:strand:- start:891 stop:1325 length:435 start_codon:yes stop_codon:yes gene_type:complete
MSFTTLEQEAVDFYETHASYVSAFGLLNLGDREDRRFFNKGKKLLNAAIESTLRAVRLSEQKWLPEEYDFIAATYVKHGTDRKAGLSEFRAAGFTRHTDDAVTFILYSAACLDKQSGLKGFKDYANGLLNALKALDTDRFAGNR